MNKVILLDNCGVGPTETETFIGLDENLEPIFGYEHPYIFKSSEALKNGLLKVEQWLEEWNEYEEYFNLRAVDVSEFLKLGRKL